MKRYRAWCSCSWHGTYRAEGLADSAMRRHSCERWNARRDAARRRREAARERSAAAGRREAPRLVVDRTPKPCRHPRANHQHGTYAAYKRDNCRCIPCAKAVSRYGKVARLHAGTGSPNLVDAEPARRHVLELLEVLTIAQIEDRSGIHRTAVRHLIGDLPGRAPARRIRRRTEAVLLALTTDRVGPESHGLVDPTGTRRRLQALVALGYPLKHLAQRAGLSYTAVWRLLSTDQTAPVMVRTRDAVRRLYDELSLTTPAPSRSITRARTFAATHGWPVPLAWDDDELDDPAASPKPVTEDTGTFRDERLDEWLFLVGAGEDHLRAAKRVGYTSVASIASVAAHLQRTDVQDALRAASTRQTRRAAA